MAKGFRRRREAHLARGRVYQVVGRERLNQCGLAIAACAEYHTLYGICAATASDHINRAMLTRIFPRRCTTLHRTRHLTELSFLFGGGQWTDLLLEQFLRRRHAFHNLPVEQSAKRSHIGYLGMILVPDRMGETSPRQSELSLDAAGYDDVIAGGAGPGFVRVLLQVVSVGLNDGEDRLGRAEGRVAFEHGEHFQRVNAAVA